LSRQERSQVIAIAAAEEAFFNQRCMAVGQLHGSANSAVKRAPLVMTGIYNFSFNARVARVTVKNRVC
jgi:hypothetical protein